MKVIGPDRISLESIKEQRELGWVDFHPETYCHRCGGRNLHSWSVDSDRFNASMAALGLDSVTIVCPPCFALGHELATGMTAVWKLVPEVFVHIED